MSAGLFALGALVLALCLLAMIIGVMRDDKRQRARVSAKLDDIGDGAARIAEYAAEWKRRAEVAEARVAELEAQHAPRKHVIHAQMLGGECFPNCEACLAKATTEVER